MQSEELDNKIREAADHHHPAYDEQAWTKMEKLLNKHLPQEKEKKRRFIFFLLFFLLLGGGAWLLISKPWANNKTVTDNNQVAVKPADQTNNKIAEQKETGEKNNNPANAETNLPENKEQDISVNSLQENKPLIQENISKNSFSKPKSEKNNSLNFSSQIPQASISSDKKSIAEISGNKKKEVVQDKEVVNIVPAQEMVNGSKNPETNAIVEEKTEKNVSGKQEATVTQPAENKTAAEATQAKAKTKSKNKKPNTFFFGFSAGPDLSFVSSNKAGTTKLILGGGIGFTFHDKLTIRTGFYTGRKVYTASPDSYNPPASWWAYYPNLEKVEADCNVFEIPLLLSYNFGAGKKSNWFASSGVSSLLMKKEVYDYFYKYTPTGPTVTRKWTIDNKNNHYFSVLTLSVGYQRKFGNHISITAEPYIKLPLTGVGFGKVKLNSGGVLFTVGLDPFNNRKPK